MASSVWILDQLAGDRLRLELADHAAPHGRARSKPVFEHEIEYRVEDTYYPGSDIPTLHVFGSKIQPITIEGRFRDAWGGGQFARNKMDEVLHFAEGKQLCRVSWDAIISIHAFIKRVKHAVEAPGEIAWEIELLVVEDLFLGAPPFTGLQEMQGPASAVEELRKLAAEAKKIPFTPPTLRGSVFDLLDQLVGVVGSATSTLVDAANQIDAFVNAPFQALFRLRAALNQSRVAVQTLRGTYDNLSNTLALESEKSDDSQAFWQLQSLWSSSALQTMRELLRAEVAAARAQRGQILLFYTAKDGDTWESISTYAYNGSAERAEDIRKANDVPSGQNPVPGTTYVVPR